MRRFLSLALLALTTPMMAFAQANAAPATPPDHGTPQGAQTAAKPAAPHSKPPNKPAAKPAAADATDTHGTPQDKTPQK